VELHGLYSSSDIIMMIKSRRMGRVGHVARLEDMRNSYKFLVGEPEGKRPLGRPRRRWEDNIKMDLRKWDLGVWIGFIWLRIGAGGCSCEHGSKPLGRVKCGEFLDQLDFLLASQEGLCFVVLVNIQELQYRTKGG
jgi:hypothetical protein